MEDLIDIQGLDHIGWWPLAVGWWFLIATIFVMLGLAIFFAWRLYKYRRSWQYQAYTRLAIMQKQLGTADHKEILQKLSEEMRKIAMLTTKREACAGLIGNKWLQWLQEHDPLGFNWQDNGLLLVNMQYMPDAMPNTSVIDDSGQISQLISAAQGWVKKC